MKPFFETDLGKLYHGECLDVLPEISGVTACVTDPPYGLNFMGKDWDHGIPGIRYWKLVMAACLPGASLLAFGGSRTVHRLVCAIEDAGWEIRDGIEYFHWIYGSGFPKSLDISKQLDLKEKNKWLDIGKAIDKTDKMIILDIWKSNLENVIIAGNSSQKNSIEAGTNTQKNGSALVPVLLLANPKKLNALAIIAELNLNEALHTTEENAPFVQGNAEVNTEQLQNLVKFAEKSLPNQEATSLSTFIAQCDVKDLLNENSTVNLKAEEVLKTLNGKKKSLNEQTISVLCAELIANLKLTILNQSKTFQNLDMKSQMDFVSATTATITESTAANLISSTVNILKNKAIDKAAGADRKVVGVSPYSANRKTANGSTTFIGQDEPERIITAPCTDSAKLWNGYGTALKPAHEPICFAMKPVEGTFAGNAIKYGVAGINVDGGRVGTIDDTSRKLSLNQGWKQTSPDGSGSIDDNWKKGRWPANVIHDGSPEVVGLFPDTQPSKGGYVRKTGDRQFLGLMGDGTINAPDGLCDSGSAARFFYCAKASREERGKGNNHPTVKPLALVKYLITLVTMPERNLILDPFAGSGTTAIACEYFGLPWVACEKDEASCEIAAKRIEHETKQLKLFK